MGQSPGIFRSTTTVFYKRLLCDTDLGFGESYMEGWWDCEALDECINRIAKFQLRTKLKDDWKTVLYVAQTKLRNRQKRERASQVAEQHYDLGNDLYRAMLDARLCYTCGYWKHATTLDQAQEAKLELVCQKINLTPGMTILELGCGWGSFAKYAAEKYDAKVVGVNICSEQVKLARELCAGLPVDIRQQDYREMEGSYDAVISIGIFEHVGYKNYRTYMEVVNRLPERRRHCLYPYHWPQYQQYLHQSLGRQIHFPQRHAAVDCPDRECDGGAVCDGRLA